MSKPYITDSIRLTTSSNFLWQLAGVSGDIEYVWSRWRYYIIYMPLNDTCVFHAMPRVPTDDMLL